MSDTGINIDPNLVIQDLLQQVNRLTADNTVLRAALQQAQQERQDAVPQTAVVDAGLDKADGPDQTK